MRCCIFAAIFLLLLTSCEKDICENDNVAAKEEIFINDETLIQGNIRILVDEEFANTIENARGEDGSVNPIEVRSAEDIMLSSGVKSLTRTFPTAGKFEDRTRKEGLHLWYDVVFDNNIPLTRVTNDFSRIKGVREIEFRRKTIRYDNNPIEIISSLDKGLMATTQDREVIYPFNDPRLLDQWHYYNKGETSDCIAGADINVLPVWKYYTTGSEDVIVSIVDGGIDFLHEDLADNMWINMAEYNGNNGEDDDENGYIDDVYGYNFLINSSEVYPNNHGTHVAGIIGAVNNNGVGVSGVAGGDFKKKVKGVRLMSCQVFSSRPEDEDLIANYAAAIKYGADNGAVISQNSWGYIELKETPKSVKAAIDYFVKYAGVDDIGNQTGPMKGGIVIFAAGNNDEEDYAPANYENVLSVASIGPDFEKASYSNYGSWVNLSAPGGQGGGKYRVLSTTPNNRYGYLQGTSMACPHVSGTAALIISHAGGIGFTNKTLWERLVDNATNIYSYNSDMQGKLGSGLVNALGSIASYGSIPPQPVAEIWGNSKSNNVFLKWLVTSDEDDTKSYGYTVYYSENNLENLDVNNLDQVYKQSIETQNLEVGDTISIKISGLNFETNYYFKIDAYDYSSNRSELSDVLKVKTKENKAPVINPLNGLSLTQKAFETKYLNFRFSDPDGHEMTWSLIAGSPAATASLVDNNIQVKVDGRDAAAGTYVGKVYVSDSYGASSFVEFIYTIEENRSPVVINPLDNVYMGSLGQEITLDISKTFYDPDGENLIYSASSDNSAVAKVTQHGNSLTITSLSYGLTNVTVLAKDALQAEIENTFAVLVRNENNEIDVYPNPVSDILNLRIGKETDAQVLLISSMGSTVFNETIKIGPFNSAHIDMSSMNAGVYTVIIKLNGKELKYNITKL